MLLDAADDTYLQQMESRSWQTKFCSMRMRAQALHTGQSGSASAEQMHECDPVWQPTLAHA